ncbi:hypothetical protein DFH28DRAFT_1196788 [Melampsora americana]|nr:hypothetical protein DFH28DRAFT_1196788 [Melampsora americana]
MEFDQALAHKNPDVFDPDRLAELEMATIGVERSVQSYATALMAKYGHVSIDGRECMGCINPGNPCEVIYLSHTMMASWAEDLKHNRQGVTIMKPPPEFPRVLINPKPNRKHTNPSTSESLASTSGPPIVPFNNNPPHQIRTDSPAPRPLPDFEDYLKSCSITADDQETRDLFDHLKITTFEIFLSPYFDCQKMEDKGFSIGAAIRLHDSTPLYRNYLKNLKRPRF